MWMTQTSGFRHTRDCDLWVERNRLPSICLDETYRLAMPKDDGKEGWADQNRSHKQQQQASGRITGPMALVHNTMVEARTFCSAQYALPSALTGSSGIMSRLDCFGMGMRHHRLHLVWGRSHQDRLYLSRFRKQTKGLSGRHCDAQGRMPARKIRRTMWVEVDASECRVWKVVLPCRLAGVSGIVGRCVLIDGGSDRVNERVLDEMNTLGSA